MFAHALHRTCWAFWIVGTALIVLNWGGIVSYQVGWIGFALAAVGFLVSRLSGLLARVPLQDESVWTQLSKAEETGEPDNESRPTS